MSHRNSTVHIIKKIFVMTAVHCNGWG